MSSGLLSLKWNNHRSTFFHVLSSIRAKESYCDATLACDGRFYPVHKLVLSTCSEYFEQMFDRTQCKHPVIVLKDIRHEELEALMNYMYVGEVNVMQEKLSGLIKAAECLKIKGLAVPDEDPSKSLKEHRRQHRYDMESPVAKRKRRDERSSSEESSKLISSQVAHREKTSNEDKLVSPHRSNSTEDKAADDSSYKKSFSRITNNENAQDLSSSNTNEDNSKVLPSKNISEQPSLNEANVKTEPPDISAEEVDVKSHISQAFDYDTSEEGNSRHAEDIDNGPDGNDSDYSNNIADSHNIEDANAQSTPSVSNVQGNSFSMWDGEGSSHNFPSDDYGGENSQGRSMISMTSEACSVSLNEALETSFELIDVSSASDMQGEDSSNKFKCSSCERFFKTMKTFVLHLRNHLESDFVRCPLCNVEKSPPALVKHIWGHYQHQRQGRKSLTDEVSMNMKKYTCSVCPYRGFNKSNLVIHMRIHTGEKPFACPQCSYRGRHKGNLISHLRIHDVTPVPCHVCGKKFFQQDLVEHMKQLHSQRASN